MLPDNSRQFSLRISAEMPVASPQHQISKSPGLLAAPTQQAPWASPGSAGCREENQQEPGSPSGHHTSAMDLSAACDSGDGASPPVWKGGKLAPAGATRQHGNSGRERAPPRTSGGHGSAPGSGETRTSQPPASALGLVHPLHSAADLEYGLSTLSDGGASGFTRKQKRNIFRCFGGFEPIHMDSPFKTKQSCKPMELKLKCDLHPHEGCSERTVLAALCCGHWRDAGTAPDESSSSERPAAFSRSPSCPGGGAPPAARPPRPRPTGPRAGPVLTRHTSSAVSAAADAPRVLGNGS